MGIRGLEPAVLLPAPAAPRAGGLAVLQHLGWQCCNPSSTARGAPPPGGSTLPMLSEDGMELPGGPIPSSPDIVHCPLLSFSTQAPMLSVDNMEPAAAVATLRRALDGLSTLSTQRAAREEALKVGGGGGCATQLQMAGMAGKGWQHVSSEQTDQGLRLCWQLASVSPNAARGQAALPSPAEPCPAEPCPAAAFC